MANSKILEAKQQVINEISEIAKNSASFILFDYRGLTAEETTMLRRKLRESGATYKVWKNTLAKRAMDSLNYDLDYCLNGPSAMAYSDDSVAAIKVLSDFQKTHTNAEIQTGVINGEVVTVDTIKEYASIPSMEGLLTMLAGGMIEHVKNLSIGLNLYAEKLGEEN